MSRAEVFRLLCDCLSLSCGGRERDEFLLEQLSGDTADWALLVEVASYNLVCPALYVALQQKQLLACIPADLAEYLETLRDLNEERNLRLVEIATETVGLLNEIGVEPVLLKGTANLFSGVYCDPGIRFISDIDMLVPGEKLAACAEKLQASDYLPLDDAGTTFWQKHHHYPRLLKRDEDIGIELHDHIVSEKYRTLLDAGEVFRGAGLVVWDGTRARIPSASHRIIHNVVHTQLQDDNYRMGQVSLRQLYDFGLLQDALGSEIHWPEIGALFRESGYYDALAAYCLASLHFFSQSLPPGIEAGPRARLNFLWLRGQKNSALLMHLSSTCRLAAQCIERLQTAVEFRRMPKFWSAHWWQEKQRWILGTWGQRW